MNGARFRPTYAPPWRTIGVRTILTPASPRTLSRSIGPPVVEVVVWPASTPMPARCTLLQWPAAKRRNTLLESCTRASTAGSPEYSPSLVYGLVHSGATAVGDTLVVPAPPFPLGGA